MRAYVLWEKSLQENLINAAGIYQCRILAVNRKLKKPTAFYTDPDNAANDRDTHLILFPIIYAYTVKGTFSSA